MIEVSEGIFVGDQKDYDDNVIYLSEPWAVVHACKEPYHRKLLGYTGRGAPKEHPEYLFAIRNHTLYLNMIDVDDPKWVQAPIIDATMGFIKQWRDLDVKVLVHCNQGQSRSPSLALLYLAIKQLISTESFEKAEEEFKKIYPAYEPKNGIRSWIKENWKTYIK